ncbi:hypothetical protein Q3G72_035404 [Acer saccharum]|nr:hypothetical protein Q3G72_035404 [Acer saccharum]
MFAAENGLKGDPRFQAISQAIRVVPHFPKPGIMFQDITTLLLDHKAFKDTVDIFVDRYRDMDISVVAGVEARGFMFGPSIALAIGAKFVPLRKPKKLPGEVISEAYVLEYGTDCLEMHVGAVQPGERAMSKINIILAGCSFTGKPAFRYHFAPTFQLRYGTITCFFNVRLLDGNQLTSTIPDSLGSVQTLEVLRLNRNDLSEEVQSNINNLTNINELNLAHNNFTGPIPDLSQMNSLNYGS